MAIVEKLSIFGIDLPFWRKEIIPNLDPYGLVTAQKPEDDEKFRVPTSMVRRFRRELVVGGNNWVRLDPLEPAEKDITLHSDQINAANIELEAKRFKFIKKVVRHIA